MESQVVSPTLRHNLKTGPLVVLLAPITIALFFGIILLECLLDGCRWVYERMPRLLKWW